MKYLDNHRYMKRTYQRRSPFYYQIISSHLLSHSQCYLLLQVRGRWYSWAGHSYLKEHFIGQKYGYIINTKVWSLCCLAWSRIAFFSKQQTLQTIHYIIVICFSRGQLHWTALKCTTWTYFAYAVCIHIYENVWEKDFLLLLYWRCLTS